MHRAIEQLNPQPQHLLIDGNRFKPYPDIPHTCVVKGDSKYEAIAAASILAKTYRDDYMNRLHEQYPMYDWNRNKGYPTKAHRAAIRQYGPTPYHRMSFQLLERQLSIFKCNHLYTKTTDINRRFSILISKRGKIISS